MTAEIVSLRKARKRRDREEARKTADANRVRFGTSKADRKKAEAEAALARKRLDDHRRDGESE